MRGTLVGLALAASVRGISPGRHPPRCRFALEWSQDQLLADPDAFAWDLLYWEGKFHQNGLAYSSRNGMSYDGIQLDWDTGAHTHLHTFSAASKEALQFMLYAHAIAGSPEAARYLSPRHPERAPDAAASILGTKLQTYLRFNETHPGFGGFLPWMTTDAEEISPTWDWVDRVPALDNGELVWAVYACIHVLRSTSSSEYHGLADAWQVWLDYVKTTAADVFYQGDGRVCAVTSIGNQSLPISHPDQSYACEGTGTLNDPYEGELFTFWLHLFGGLSNQEKARLWEVKRPQLVSVEYQQGGVGPITVEKGYWFSGHEPWKVLQLPYYDVDIFRRVYHNAERVRTCNSVVTQTPGLFASVNNSTDPETDDIIGYISPAGIPSIANQTEQYHDVITPYAAWPTIMFDRAVGLAWWRNTVLGKKMQNPYGSTESTRVDGELVSALLTWDSKVLTVISLLGGVGDIVRDKMKAEGIYDEFIDIVKREYSSEFGEVKGEDVELCLPNTSVPHAGLEDFTLCSE
ncbi:putative GPI anchored protein [Stachybotrys elegans]|uniref:GPI anchored protein n=1 Tax=Stachybotrys elegans TaxID=80388 RepID=A0A8K0SJB6_9HYPO|nr:putative GPI anchored protein [Stachybotrys elegans]